MVLKALGEPEKYFSLSRKELVEVHKVAYEKSEIKIKRIVKRKSVTEIK